MKVLILSVVFLVAIAARKTRLDDKIYEVVDEIHERYPDYISAFLSDMERPYYEGKKNPRRATGAVKVNISRSSYFEYIV